MTSEDLPPEAAKRVLQRSTSTIVEDMKPDCLCDLMLGNNMLPQVDIRDIREKPTTTEKNRAITNAILTDIHKYQHFKECLLATQQDHLVALLTEAEREVIREMTRVPPRRVRTLSTKVLETKRGLMDWYKRNCRVVSVNPESPEDQMPVSRLYVRPQMKVIQSRRTDEVASSRRQTCCGGFYVENYKQIFHVGDTLCKNIYISGDAGFGKTAFCENLVNKWWNVHNRDVLYSRVVEETSVGWTSIDEQVMSQFDILFYISLRHSIGCGSIEEMIKDQLIDIDEEIFETTKCLIVLDGLDEWTPPPGQGGSRAVSAGLPKRSNRLASSCTILTTSRPWKLEALRLRTTEIDNHVKICGLTESASEKLVENTVEELNDRYEKSLTVVDFSQTMQERNIKISALCPIFLMHLVCLWHDGLRLGNSCCDVFSGMVDLTFARGEEKLGEDERVHATSGHSKHTPLPGCFNDREFCERYKNLLLTACRLAFKTLLGGSRENELVFDSSAAEKHGLSKKDIGACLKFGIISQSKGNRIVRTKVMSFPHKTFQEFLAAVHVVVEKVDILASADVDSILKMSHILLFVVGMVPGFAEKVAQYLMASCDKDERFITYRTSSSFSLMDSSSYMLICNVQEFLCECQSNLSPSHKVKIGDVVIDANTLASRANCLLKMDTSQARSLYIDIPSSCVTDDSARRYVNDVMEHVRGASCLQRIFIWDSCSALCIEHVDAILANRNLVTIGMRGIELVRSSELSQLFSNLQGLSSLRLQCISLRHDQICDIVSFLPSASDLRELVLETIHCVDHGEGCSFNLDISGNTKLQSLYLENLNVDNVSINPASLKVLKIRYLISQDALRSVIQCLSSCEKLEILDCRGCLDLSTAGVLVQKIATLTSLKILVLWQTNIDSSELVLSSLTSLELVRINKVLFTHNSFKAFIESLPDCRKETNIELEGIIILDSNCGDTLECIECSTRFQITRPTLTLPRNKAFSIAFLVKEPGVRGEIGSLPCRY